MIRTRILTVLLCFVIGLTAIVQSAYANEWPQWRGPARDGKSFEANVNLDWTKSEPKHLWTIDGMGTGYASVSIVDNHLYTTGNVKDAQAVICVDLNTHKTQWTTPLTDKAPKHGYEGSRCTPTIDGDRAYVVSSNGEVSCLNTKDGAIVWQRDFKDWKGKMMSGWGYSESPLVDGDWVLCTPGGKAGMIVALDKKTGEEVWASAAPADLGEKGKDGAGYSSIVISEAAGVKQYVQLVGRGLISVRAKDGKFLWNYNQVANGTANIPTPICFGDYVFGSTGYGTGAALLKITKYGANVVANEEYFLGPKTFQNHHGGMILDGEYLYAGHNHSKGFPICLHLPTGEIKWGGDFRPEGKGSAALTYVNGTILFRYQDGKIALVTATPEGYELKGTFTPEYQEGKSWSHPVVVDGKLYLREQNKLMCYEL